MVKEELTHINLGDAREHLPFDHTVAWRTSAVRGRRTSSFISTSEQGDPRLIRIHQEGHQSRSRTLAAATLPRTALSSVNAAESPTALLARQEMRSWRLLQLEPQALRRPDDFTAPPRLGMDGSCLPATLAAQARAARAGAPDEEAAEAAERRVYAQVANRLADLLDDVRAVAVDRDERRELLTLQVTDRHGTVHAARALSDGALRFLALAVLANDPAAHGVLCLEEPENGIHPTRIPAMLHLLQAIATDPTAPVGPDNPLRQVIVNTHAPAVVRQAPEDSLVAAALEETIADGRRFQRVCFQGLSPTWRQPDGGGVALGHLLAYLTPDEPPPANGASTASGRPPTLRRVIDRPDVRQLLLPLPSSND